jgi:hypothetical protein
MSEIYYDKVYRFLNKRKPPEFLKQPQEQLLHKLRATTVIVAPFSEKDVAAYQH